LHSNYGVVVAFYCGSIIEPDSHAVILMTVGGKFWVVVLIGRGVTYLIGIYATHKTIFDESDWFLSLIALASAM
jgi:hypothetical protein